MSLTIQEIRTQFPSLKEGAHYLDSAASSLTPEPVLCAMDEYYREYRANIHRGLYREAERATEEYERARMSVARFIGARPSEVVFTGSATLAANMLVYALERTLVWEDDDEIVLTVAEHHALLVPLQELARRKKLTLKYVQLTKGCMLDERDLAELVTPKARIVAVMGASNVTGSRFGINTSIRTSGNTSILGETRPIVIRDCTALMGHVPVDVAHLGADFAFFSGHKMFGPTGVGILWGRGALLTDLEPGFYGGGMISEVTCAGARYQNGIEKFEPGTPNIAGVIGLGAAVTYLERIGLEHIHTYTRELVAYMQKELASIPGVTVYSAPPEHNVGVASFTVEGVHSHDVAQICADVGVAVRPGHHCAQPLHMSLDIESTTRASLHVYNTKEDIDALVKGVRTARTLFQN